MGTDTHCDGMAAFVFGLWQACKWRVEWEFPLSAKRLKIEEPWKS